VEVWAGGPGWEKGGPTPPTVASGWCLSSPLLDEGRSAAHPLDQDDLVGGLSVCSVLKVGSVLEELLGALVWLAANGLYIDFKRKGRKGWQRIFLFWMGIPATWLWLFFIRERKEPLLPPPTDDFEGILSEIKRDKALKAREEDGDEKSLPPGPPPAPPPAPSPEDNSRA